MFEHYHQPLISFSVFLKRILLCIAISSGMFLITILIGLLFFHLMGNFSWIDGLLNSVTLMTGQGIYTPMNSTSLKVFTSFYAILSTVVFFMIIGVLFSPIVHRFLHKFHLDIEKKK